MEEKVTIREAAKRLHKSEQFVRIGLQRNILPFGVAMQISNKKWTYYISPGKLREFIGTKENEQETREKRGDEINV